MVKRRTQLKRIKQYSLLLVGSLVGLLVTTPNNKVEGAGLGGPTHIGTFEGSTTFTTSSSNGVNPGLFIEVMDEYGNLTQYESEEGVITVTNTKEGAYVTQAKLLGKTKYRDQDTGELFDQFEEGRNLELVSVENPELKTVGKNLFDKETSNYINAWLRSTKDIVGSSHIKTFYMKCEPNTRYTISKRAGGYFRVGTSSTIPKANDKLLQLVIADDDTSITLVTDSLAQYLCFNVYDRNVDTLKEEEILNTVQVEKSFEATSYEPYQSNALTTNEEVMLKGLPSGICDTIDLITGEVTQRIGEVVLDGSDDEIWNTNSDGVATETLIQFNIGASVFNGLLPKLVVDQSYENLFMQDKFALQKTTVWDSKSEVCALHTPNPTHETMAIQVKVLRSRLIREDLSGWKTFLRSKPWTIQYELATPIIENVFLNSAYYFQPVMNRDVYVDGSILPLVCSVTIPTESLAFVLNPNAEVGQQFIAPEFTVVNHTPTSIYLELKRFEQLTTVMNDVLPEAHEDWSQLNREQSKDIALALVPQPSEGWLNLEEGPRYVADDSNYYLGEVKAESSVDFTFIASHGRAFVEPIDPKYRLSFVFDFFE